MPKQCCIALVDLALVDIDLTPPITCQLILASLYFQTSNTTELEIINQTHQGKMFERPPIIRPPSEWQSYYLPLTSGCSNHSCTFCNYYHDAKLRIRDAQDVKREIDALALYVKSGLQMPTMPPIVYEIARHWDGKRIFLQDGDALVYPYQKLTEVLDYVNSKMPFIQRIGAYATPQDVLRRTINELELLNRLKLKIIYMGVESGDDEVLRKVRKGVDATQIIEAGRKAKAAGIILSVTVILGLAGKGGSERHALQTAKILTEIDPDFAAALTLIPDPGTPIFHEAERGELQLLTPFESLEELRTIVANASFTNCFFSSMHASNYFSIRGRLPYDQHSMLQELDLILTRRDPTLLRPEFLRGL